MDTFTKQIRPHIGKNIHAIRILRGVKQEALAMTLGTNQREVSQIEQSEHIDETLLERIAVALGVSVEIIKSYDETSAFYSINNHIENSTFNESSTAIHQDFNPVQKIVELYERLLNSEREKIVILQKQRDNSI